MAARRLSCFLGLCLLGSMTPEPAAAATFTVNKFTDDNGPCTVDDCALREAIIAANENPGLDTVIVPAGEHQLSIVGPPYEYLSRSGDLNIFDDLELRGDEDMHLRSTIMGDGRDRVIAIISRAAPIAVTISNLKITGGRSLEGGGGIRIESSRATLINLSVEGNETTGSDSGGVAAYLSEVTMINCTVTGNTAYNWGGGIGQIGLDNRASNLTLINTTVSGNSAFLGGGILNEGRATLYLINSTIANNTSTRRGDALALSFGAHTVLSNTLIEGECTFPEAIAPFSNGGNIESPGATCYLPHPTDRMNVPDLRLGPLADNGGPTLTHALWSDSPAIDSADPASCPADDQRGTQRPVDGDGDGTASCDVGAYELLPVPAAVEVPALSPVGILLLVLLLAGIAVHRVRRHQFQF
jgi:CSLREA domain-containing protein